MLKSGALWTIAGLVSCALAFMSDWAQASIYVLAGFATAFGAAQLAAIPGCAARARPRWACWRWSRTCCTMPCRC